MRPPRSSKKIAKRAELGARRQLAERREERRRPGDLERHPVARRDRAPDLVALIAHRGAAAVRARRVVAPR
jgi:hypothetical protein